MKRVTSFFLACLLLATCASRPVNGTAGSLVSLPNTIGTLVSGASLSSFSGSSYSSATNQGPDLCGSGKSFAVAFDNAGGTAPAHAIVLGHYDTSTGCYLDVAAGVVTLVQNPGGVVASFALTLAANSGVHVFAVTNTGGNFRAFLDGVGGSAAPKVVAASGTYAAPDAAAVMLLGAGTSGASPWPGGVLHLKAYSRVLTDAELYALSGNRHDNWYTLLAASGGDTSLTLDAEPARDHSGTMWTTLGSSPVTFTDSGTPALASESSCWINRATLMGASMFLDTAATQAMPTAYGRFVIRTSDPTIFADYDNGSNGALAILASTYIDGVYSTAQCGPDGCNPSTLTYASTTGQVFPIAVGGGSHLVEVGDGEAILTGNPPSAPTGSASLPLRGLRTAACPAPAAATLPANGHVVLIGDSLCVGAVSTQLGRFGWTSLLRDAYRLKGVDVSMYCQSGNSLTMNVSMFYGSTSSMAADLVALVQRVQPGGAKWIGIALGENDLGLTNPSFGTQYQTLMTQMYALDHAVHVLAITPAYSCSQESAAVTIRGVISTAVANANAAVGTTFAFFEDNTNTVSVGNVTACPHWNNLGHAQQEAKTCADLPFGC